VAKTIIKGRFATAADIAGIHQISASRREWLDREVGKAIADTVIYAVPVQATHTSTTGKTKKPSARAMKGGAKRSARTARLRATKK